MTLYKKVIIPQSVYRELEALGEPEIKQVQQPWITVEAGIPKESIDAFQKRTQLDAGESEAILLTQYLKADLLLIDEKLGRAEAQRLGIRITGLLGVLLEAKYRHLIKAIKPLMDKLIAESKFRVSPSLYDLILKKAAEA